MRKVKQGRWWIVVNNNGNTVAQFLSNTDADFYIFVQTHNRGLGVVENAISQSASRLHDATHKHLSIMGQNNIDILLMLVNLVLGCLCGIWIGVCASNNNEK